MNDTANTAVAGPDVQIPQMTGQAVSDLLGFSPRWLNKLVSQGLVERKENGLFDLVEVCLGYIRWLKDDNRRNSKTEVAKLKEAEQVRKLKLENAKLEGELADMETVETVFLEMFTTLRANIDAVPAGVTRDLAQRAEIQKRIDLAFETCRKTFEATHRSIRDGCPSLPRDEDGADE